MIHSNPETATVELIQTDLRALSNETRKKFPPIKEAAESAILKIKTLTTLNQKHQQETPLSPLRKHCQIVLQEIFWNNSFEFIFARKNFKC